MEDFWTADILAFLVVECGAQLPYEVICNLSQNDQLFQSIVKRFEQREDRLDRRNAWLCLNTARSFGGSKLKLEDFMPQKKILQSEIDEQIKQRLIKHNEAYTQGLIQ